MPETSATSFPSMPSSRHISGPVWVGMSGGVDSSLAAALLVEAGYTCTGVTLDLGRGETDRVSVASSVAVCRHLGIPHRTIDLAAEFRAAVIDATAAAYSHGRTPNPCVFCNAAIKFGTLYRMAVDSGAALATGHYARIAGDAGDRRLARAVDAAKDQSYFLYRVAPDVLEGAVFPLGTLTKNEVRGLAAKRGISSIHTAESQDACFLGRGGYPALIKERYPEACRPGPVIAGDGEVIGTHDGVCRFTVGQRKGIGIASAEALYVTGIDASRNAVIVGSHADLETSTLVADDAVWWGGGEQVECDVQVRYNSPPVAALVTPDGTRLRIELVEPVFGAAPGQSAVCYQGDTIIGGGFIGGAQ